MRCLLLLSLLLFTDSTLPTAAVTEETEPRVSVLREQLYNCKLSALHDVETTSPRVWNLPNKQENPHLLLWFTSFMPNWNICADTQGHPRAVFSLLCICATIGNTERGLGWGMEYKQQCLGSAVLEKWEECYIQGEISECNKWIHTLFKNTHIYARVHAHKHVKPHGSFVKFYATNFIISWDFNQKIKVFLLEYDSHPLPFHKQSPQQLCTVTHF